MNNVEYYTQDSYRPNCISLKFTGWNYSINWNSFSKFFLPDESFHYKCLIKLYQTTVCFIWFTETANLLLVPPPHLIPSIGFLKIFINSIFLRFNYFTFFFISSSLDLFFSPIEILCTFIIFQGQLWVGLFFKTLFSNAVCVFSPQSWLLCYILHCT